MNNTVAGIAIGGITGATIVIADVIAGSSLALRDAAAICIFICGLVWWMGRKFQSLEDKLKEHARFLSNLPCNKITVCDAKNKTE